MAETICYSCMSRTDAADGVCHRCGSVVPYIPADSRDLFPGTLLHGRYTVGRLLGRGGFGATYLALDGASGKLCAVKEYFPAGMCTRDRDSAGVSAAPGARQEYQNYLRSFRQEAARLEELRSVPGVVHVIENFEENGTAYFAMDYIAGQTLNEYVRSNAPDGLTLKEAVRTVMKLLETLQAVHERGILHRDISADNIMRLRSGELVLIDFGSSREMLQMKKTTFSKGVYTAPEQRYGDAQQACTDLYAAGVLLFYLIRGRVPGQEGLQLEKLRGVRAGMPDKLNDVYETATAVNPNFRYQSAADMLHDLRSVYPLLPAEADRSTVTVRKRRAIRLLLVFCVLLLALIILAIAGALR